MQEQRAGRQLAGPVLEAQRFENTYCFMGWRGLSKAPGFVSQSPALFGCHIALTTLHLLPYCLDGEAEVLDMGTSLSSWLECSTCLVTECL